MAEATSRRTALVTGASAGLGEAFARVFAEHGFDLVLTARREHRLRDLALSLTEQYGVRTHVIVADLSDPRAPAGVVEQMASQGLTIDALVNNAGYGRVGTYLASSWREHAEFLQVLVVSVAELTYRLLPGMIERRYGRIINVASVAGMVPATAGHTLYGAAKALVIKFSESLAAETAASGVHVTAVCPGFTRTEFHDVNLMRSQVDTMPSWMWLRADRVARDGYRAVMRGRPIDIPGGLYKTIVLLARCSPGWLVRRVARRQARYYRRT